MLAGSKRERPIPGSRPINHSDVLMRVRNTMDVQKTRSNQCARPGSCRGRPLAKQFDIKAAFLLCLAQSCLLRVFVEFHMASEWQPFVQLAMMNHQHLAIVDNKNRHCEIYFLVNVSHVFKK